MAKPGTTALGAWSGGRFMHFGVEIPEERLISLMRPDPDHESAGIRTLITADTYGQGAADSLTGRALEGLDREAYSLVGAVGHDFYEGERDGAKGFPRFTDPGLRSAGSYGDYLRMAAERSLERIGTDRFDVLLLHNPDRIGYTSEEVWAGMAALRDGGLTRAVGVAPGPANGFTLDVIDCLERFGELIDWAMIILNPLERWPGELVLPAAERFGVDLIARVVDYGGLFWDDVLPGHAFARFDHRAFRPEGWVQAGRGRLERMRPIAERHGLTMLQLAAQRDLAHPAVRCAVPTLIEESAPDAKPIEAKRAELAAVPGEVVLGGEEVDEIRAIGDNAGCMALKGASPQFTGEPRADAWPLTGELRELAGRWSIAPERDLARTA